MMKHYLRTIHHDAFPIPFFFSIVFGIFLQAPGIISQAGGMVHYVITLREVVQEKVICMYKLQYAGLCRANGTTIKATSLRHAPQRIYI